MLTLICDETYLVFHMLCFLQHNFFLTLQMIFKFSSCLQAIDCTCFQSSWKGPGIHIWLCDRNLFCYPYCKLLVMLCFVFLLTDLMLCYVFLLTVLACTSCWAIKSFVLYGLMSVVKNRMNLCPILKITNFTITGEILWRWKTPNAKLWQPGKL